MNRDLQIDTDLGFYTGCGPLNEQAWAAIAVILADAPLGVDMETSGGISIIPKQAGSAGD